MREFKAALSLLRMRRNLRISPEVLQNEQTRRVREVVRHAYSTTRYYRNLFESSGVRPRDIRTLSDLTRIPISRKEDLLRIPLEDRIAKGTDFGGSEWMNSAGSSGTPWGILISPSEKLRKQLMLLRAKLANGYRFSHSTCRFWDPRIPYGAGHWFQRLGLLRQEYVSLFDSLDNKLRILGEGNFDVVFGLSSDLFVLAETMLERGIAPAPPKVVITFGEVLYSLHRRIIHEGFGRAPTDFYGSVEFGLVAWQCPQRRRYHVNADLFILELVQGDNVVGPGGEGEIVVTDLAQRAMPMIRFGTDDWARSSKEPCPCGITLPTLSHISGRMWDFLLLPSGKRIAPFYLTTRLEDIPGIRSFQVTQVSRSDVVVKFVRRSNSGEDPSTAILQALRPIIGETMELHVQEVASIPRPRGKFRVVENMLTRGGQV